jgi:hypothetical protein
MEENVDDVKLKLISERRSDGKTNNKPTVSEVATLILRDVDRAEKRDIIIQARDGALQHVDEFHLAYLGYQYHLIFLYGEDHYRNDITHRKLKGKHVAKRSKLTIREWLAFRVQSRKFEAKTLMHSRRLFQQFLVDGFTMMEAKRLNFLRFKQSKLRVGKYKNLNEHLATNSEGANNLGKHVVLPTSFVGGKRYMDALYFDGMAISATVGFPDLFITFTCNPNWLEIQGFLQKDNLKPQDRPYIVTRVFNIKFDEFLKDLTKRNVLGKAVACKIICHSILL